MRYARGTLISGATFSGSGVVTRSPYANDVHTRLELAGVGASCFRGDYDVPPIQHGSDSEDSEEPCHMIGVDLIDSDTRLPQPPCDDEYSADYMPTHLSPFCESALVFECDHESDDATHNGLVVPAVSTPTPLVPPSDIQQGTSSITDNDSSDTILSSLVRFVQNLSKRSSLAQLKHYQNCIQASGQEDSSNAKVPCIGGPESPVRSTLGHYTHQTTGILNSIETEIISAALSAVLPTFLADESPDQEVKRLSASAEKLSM